MTSIVENSDPFSSSKSIQFWSDAALLGNTMDLRKIPLPKKKHCGIAHVIRLGLLHHLYC